MSGALGCRWVCEVRMNYDYLRNEYPETVSMDQLYRICHISKRKAKWLLENRIIPCQDSGRQTRRFQIRLEDIITFLERRDAGLLRGDIPPGIFSSGGRTLQEPRQILDSGALCAFLLDRWVRCPGYANRPTSGLSVWLRAFDDQPLGQGRYRGSCALLWQQPDLQGIFGRAVGIL